MFKNLFNSKKRMKNAIIVISGGLDSAVTAYYVKNRLNYNNILFLFFNYSQRTLKEELFCTKELAKKLNAKLKIINIKWLGEISTALLNKEKSLPKVTEKDLSNIQHSKEQIINYWVPCRNSIFLISALAHAESEYISKKERYDIFIGIKQEGEIAMKDTTPKFLNSINNLAEQATHHGNYKIIAPFINKDKDEVVKTGNELNVPFELTYSCYQENSFKNNLPTHCGTCENCMLRKKAFYFAAIKDPTIYKNVPPK